MNFPAAQIQNCEAPPTPAQYLAGQWGYRFRIPGGASSGTTLDLESVGPNNVAGGVVIAPDLGTVWNLATQDAMDAAGSSTGVDVNDSLNTTFNVYWCSAGDFAGGLGFSTTAPTRIGGLYVLGAGAVASLCLFLGWIRIDGSGNVNDSREHRGVVNYWNRRMKDIRLVPEYVDDDTDTSYGINTAVWAPISSSGAQGFYIGNGEASYKFTVEAMLEAVTAARTLVGIGDNSTTEPIAIASLGLASNREHSATADGTVSPAFGSFRSINLLAMTSGSPASFFADLQRDGAAADPPATYLHGLIAA